MTEAELDRMLQAMVSAGLAEMEVSAGTQRVLMRREAGLVTPEEVPDRPSNEVSVISPAIGRFRAAPQLQTLSGRVEAGQILGFVEFQGILQGIVSPETGRLVSALPEERVPLGYGDRIAILAKEQP